MDNYQISQFGIIALFILTAVLFLGLALVIGKMIRPQKPNEEKLTPYECGEEPSMSAWYPLNARFYILAILFILFEIEILFLFPWSLAFNTDIAVKNYSFSWIWFSIIEIGIFISILVLGLAYAWVFGYLDWIKPSQKKHSFKSPVPTDLYKNYFQKND